MSNLLQFEKSPYLLQHKDNPVDWRPWSADAFTAARQQDKPVFLSVGYSTCHWCHVMAHESFEDETVAAVLNRSFVSVKVDREERPDIDGVYMAACIAMTGSGGWPLTVLLTPDQKPFWAGTYLPKTMLLSLLKQVEQMWNQDRESLLETGDQLTEHLRQEQESKADVPARTLVEQATRQFDRMFDPAWGGFGQAPKFPTPHNLLFLMRYARRCGDRGAMAMAEKSLEAMYRGGLFDHVGGGFSRYATDRRWLVPHFEKMLYDNALLLFTYAEAYGCTHRPLYERVARRTAEYVLRELRAPEGGFYCGQDADSEGVEGKYYVFTPKELRILLGKTNGERFCHWYGITPEGNFEGQSIPNLIGQHNIEEEPEGLEAMRHQVYRYRQERNQLHKDDKILTAWNGLMVAALAKAGQTLGERAYLEAAASAVAFIRQHLTDEKGNLLARWRDGESAIPGKLEDHAFYAWGLLELYEATFDLGYLTGAQQMAERLLSDFFDREKGGLYPYSAEGEQLITRTKEVYDGAMPSGNAVGALVFSRLARLTGQVRWKEAAEVQFAYLAGAVKAQPMGHSVTMLALLEELWPSAQLVCTANKVPEELINLLREEMPLALSVVVKTPENREQLAAVASFTEAYSIPEQGENYYLCQNGACTSPTDRISDVKAKLREQTGQETRRGGSGLCRT